jgi:pyrroline-5-carboxylate reductase
MGSALAVAIARSRDLRKRFSLRVHAKSGPPKAQGEQGISFTKTVQELVCDSDITILAVRPEQVESVLHDVVSSLGEEDSSRSRILVSVAAGVPLHFLRAHAAKKFAVVRIMPNTLVEIGRGLFGLCGAAAVSGEQKSLILSLFNGLGTVIELEESKMNPFTALAGCGPGFLFHIMDSFCEAGVSVGLTREASQAIAISLMAGCGALAESTGRHPVLLREQGTSPAGMTIAGLNHLDRTGMRGHVIDAVKIALQQGEAMNQETGKKSLSLRTC